jgi:protein CWC15
MSLYTHARFRHPGQGGSDETEGRDLRTELLEAEASYFAKKNGKKDEHSEQATSIPAKRQLKDTSLDEDEDENEEAKRRRTILEEAQDLDADSAGSSDESSEDEYAFF